MLHNFKAYELAVQFHKECQKLVVPVYLRDQLQRATSSVVQNIAEGSGKPTLADKKRFYGIALGSLRESVAALELRGAIPVTVYSVADELGACLYRLCHPKK